MGRAPPSPKRLVGPQPGQSQGSLQGPPWHQGTVLASLRDQQHRGRVSPVIGLQTATAGPWLHPRPRQGRGGRPSSSPEQGQPLSTRSLFSPFFFSLPPQWKTIFEHLDHAGVSGAAAASALTSAPSFAVPGGARGSGVAAVPRGCLVPTQRVQIHRPPGSRHLWEHAALAMPWVGVPALGASWHCMMHPNPLRCSPWGWGPRPAEPDHPHHLGMQTRTSCSPGAPGMDPLLSLPCLLPGLLPAVVGGLAPSLLARSQHGLCLHPGMG